MLELHKKCPTEKKIVAPISRIPVSIDIEFTPVEQQAISATRRHLNTPLARKIVQFMENKHSADFVLPDGTKLEDSVCVNVPVSRECASVVAWSQQSVLGDGCEKMFLDVGANIGMHARFLFQPDLYKQRHPYSAIFDAEFGVNRTRNPGKPCTCIRAQSQTQRKTSEIGNSVRQTRLEISSFLCCSTRPHLEVIKTRHA